MSSSVDTMPPKLLSISAKHGEKDPQVIAPYEGGFRNSVVVMGALEIKRVKDDHTVLTMNN